MESFFIRFVNFFSLISIKYKGILLIHKVKQDRENLHCENLLLCVLNQVAKFIIGNGYNYNGSSRVQVRVTVIVCGGSWLKQATIITVKENKKKKKQ